MWFSTFAESELCSFILLAHRHAVPSRFRHFVGTIKPVALRDNLKVTSLLSNTIRYDHTLPIKGVALVEESTIIVTVCDKHERDDAQEHVAQVITSNSCVIMHFVIYDMHQYECGVVCDMCLQIQGSWVASCY